MLNVRQRRYAYFNNVTEQMCIEKSKRVDKSEIELRKSIDAIDKVIKSLINENLKGMYKPPFDITSEMLHLISEISEQVGIINMRLGYNTPSPQLLAGCDGEL